VRKIKLLMFGVVLAALLALPAAAMAKTIDRDHDRLPDSWEKRFGLSTHRNGAKGDRDHDGLTNLGEFRSRTNPRKADSNNNGITDPNEDRDHDGVDNRNEMQEGTNPGDRDSDDDGVNDGLEDRDHDGLNNAGEDRTGNNPVDPDSDDDGIHDGEEHSGTIVSFVEDSANPGSGVLTIRLADNSTISGPVDSSTRIECRTDEHHHGENRGSSGGDNSGPGSGNSGPGRRLARDDERQCTTADLTAGTPVHEAELEVEHGQTVFRKVRLLK
jgi:hypothetical protein